jgi:pimeloyl-ACP methyl ester carboxylesterase
MEASERDLEAGGFRLRVRETGEPEGRPVIHFHGTPSSRLELGWGEATPAGGVVLAVALSEEAYLSALSPADLKALENPAYAGAFFLAIAEGLQAGKAGYAWDNLGYLPAWEFDLSAIRSPIYLWYGDEDLLAKPTHRWWHRERIPTARLTMREATGHLGIFPHLAQMLAELKGPAV